MGKEFFVIDQLDKVSCTGCTACAQSCPKKCIVMKEDREGFLYPQIIKESCIQCGLCSKVCPSCENTGYVDYCLSAYAAYIQDEEIRLKSSSGGIFSLLAEKVLEENGIVFGAAFDENRKVHHIGIEKMEQLDLLRGSKYMQSRIENTYCEVRKALELRRKVLFTGTGCQIAGLKSYLKKEYETLFTVDVLCHGVPSTLLWERYITEQKKKYGSELQSVYFRNKENGWKDYQVVLEFENSSRYVQNMRNDPFMQMFLSDICLRPSCHECQYKKLERPSDLTIGDAWGIGSYMPEMDDDRGTSVILVHTEKGMKAIDQLQNRMCLKEGDVEKLLPKTADSRKSVVMHMNRKKFFAKLSKGAELKELYSCLQPSYYDRIKRKMKMVLSFINNGGYL